MFSWFPHLLLLLAVFIPESFSTKPNERLYVDDFSQSRTGFVFAAVGDWGCVNDQADLVLATLSRFLDANKSSTVFLLGDNFYPNGLSDPHKDNQIQDTFLSRFTIHPPLKDATYYVVAGNHDWRDNMEAQLDYKFHPAQTSIKWRFPTIWYTNAVIFNDSTLGKQLAVFINLESYMLVEDRYYPSSHVEKQRKFIKEALKEAAKVADYIIVNLHHPPYSSGRHGSNPKIVELLETFYEYGVDIIFAGHDHHLEVLTADIETRRQTLSPSDPQYPMMVVSGSACKLTSKANPIPNSAFFAKAHGFAGVGIDNGYIELKLYDMYGQVLKTYRRRRRDDRDCIKSEGRVAKVGEIKENCSAASSKGAWSPEKEKLSSVLVTGEYLELEYRWSGFMLFINWVWSSLDARDVIFFFLIPFVLLCLCMYAMLRYMGVLKDEAYNDDDESTMTFDDDENTAFNRQVSFPLRETTAA